MFELPEDTEHLKINYIFYVDSVISLPNQAVVLCSWCLLAVSSP